MKSVELLRRLTPEQKAILVSRNVKLHRTPDDLLALLEPLAELDSQANSERERNTVLMLLCAIPATVLTVVGFFFPPPARTGCWIGALLLAVLAVYLLLRRVRPIRASRTSVSPNLREVALPFLRILRQDLADGEALQVHMSLDALEDGKHKLAGSTSSETSYVDPWFEGQATLAEGTRLQWRVVDRLRVRVRRKRSSSGKTKTKTKRMLRSDVAVKLAFPSRLYSAPGTPDLAGTPAPTEAAKRVPVALKKTQKTDGTDIVSLSMLLDLIADGFRQAAARNEA